MDIFTAVKEKGKTVICNSAVVKAITDDNGNWLYVVIHSGGAMRIVDSPLEAQELIAELELAEMIDSAKVFCSVVDCPKCDGYARLGARGDQRCDLCGGSGSIRGWRGNGLSGMFGYWRNFPAGLSGVALALRSYTDSNSTDGAVIIPASILSDNQQAQLRAAGFVPYPVIISPETRLFNELAGDQLVISLAGLTGNWVYLAASFSEE